MVDVKSVVKLIKMLRDCGIYDALKMTERNDIEEVLKLVAMVAVFGSTLTILNSDVDLEPYQFAKLADHPNAKEVGEQILLSAVVGLANGAELDWQWRTLIGLWAQQRLSRHPNWYKHKRRGRPNEGDKAVSVAFAYDTKLKKHPNRKQDAIIAELEREFGLKRRRILEMIERFNRRTADKAN
jgi:hypothetical protein